MMRFTLVLILCTCMNTSFGQRMFAMNSAVGSGLIVQVNGNSYELDSTFTPIKTHFPAFDTLVFHPDPSTESTEIICNFKADSSYSINYACCGSLDVVPSYKLDLDSLKIWDYEMDAYKITRHLCDRPFISLVLENPQPTDTIYGWNADYACFPKFKRLSEIPWAYGVPDKCFYWTNINWFYFFTSEDDFTPDTNEFGEVEDVYPDTYSGKEQTLGRINVRLFDGGRYIIRYNPITKVVSINYE